MQSETNIFNAALIECGSDPLLSALDDSKSSRLCAHRYPDVRDSTLRLRFWNCAMKRAQLAMLSDDPAWGPAHAFQMPSDWLRTKECDTGGCDWRIEGRTIVTDSDSCDLLYVRRVTDVSSMDELLCQTIVLRLAASMAYSLKGDAELAGRLEARWRDILNDASYADALEQRGDSTNPTAFTDARLTGSSDALWRGIS